MSNMEEKELIYFNKFMNKALNYLEVALQCGVHPCSKTSFIMEFKQTMQELINVDNYETI